MSAPVPDDDAPSIDMPEIVPTQVTVEMVNVGADVWIAPCGTPLPDRRADYEANGWRRLL